MKEKIKNISVYILIGIMLIFNSCSKTIQIPPPVSTITSSQVFSTDNLAQSALAGIYSNMINTSSVSFASGGLTIFGGLSADELISFDQNYEDGLIQFQMNSIQSINSLPGAIFWTPGYSYIYQANAVLSGLSLSSGVHDSVKNQLTGEAKFIRALCYFYLTNLFGEAPLVLTIDFHKTSILAKSSQSEIYQQIILDLQSAQNLLGTDYTISSGERIRPNKWAAKALLSRVYLYIGDWVDANAEADSIIKNTQLFNLETDLNNVFLKNNSEAIFQLQQSNATFPYNGTVEGVQIIPFDSTVAPFVYLTKQLIASFEPGDERKTAWVNQFNYSDSLYYIPFKYKTNITQVSPNTTSTEYYMVFRLAEQYLIRAESYAHLNDNINAINDLNVLRERAKLSDLSSSLNQSQVLAAVAQERKIEFFAEWGNRWFDLKRTGQATTILSTTKGISISNNSLLYPIPLSDLTSDPNMTQNPGY